MAAPDNPNRSAARVPLWVKLLLGLSLALNLAIAGFVAGSATRGDRHHAPQSVNYALPYVMALPRDERRAVFRGIRSAARADPAIPDRATNRALYAEMLVALRAEPFDPGAIRDALSRQAEASQRFQAAAQTAWLARVTSMSPAERAAYAFRVEEVLRHGARHDRSRRKPGDGD